jgi:hypothetical protein
MSDTAKQYQEAMDGIALARATVNQVAATIREGLDSGDDLVIMLHNMAGSLSKETPFQTGGHGAAVFVVAVLMLLETREELDAWLEIEAIPADPEALADLAESIDDLGDIGANYVEVAASWCSGYCAEVPSGVQVHDPRCSEYREPE